VMALVRLDGQYGDVTVIRQLILAGVYAHDARQRLSALGASPEEAACWRIHPQRA